ncbi:MAG TPA: MFS transporter [Symbiobacteriaceae bacterium]|nr:MFS transporter [Symbiobacteriaceae bacterium]
MSWVYFFLFGAVGALSPYQSLYYQQMGLSGTEISWLMSVTPILVFISQPIFGPLTDRSGHRGQMLARLLVVVAATCALVALGHSFWTMLPLVALWSFFSSVLVPIGDSIALGEVVRKGGDYSRIRLWGSIGFLIVSYLTGYLYKLIDLRWMFLVYAALMLIAWYYARRLPAEGVSAPKSVWSGVAGLLKNKLLLAFLLCSSIVWMSQAAHSTFYSVRMAEIGGASETVGLAYSLAALMEVPVWMVLGRITRRTGPLPLLAFASIMYGIRWQLVAVVTVPGVLVAMQVMQAVTFALFMTTAIVFVGQQTPPELRASGQALLSLVQGGIATVIGTRGAGYIVDTYGTAQLYKVGSYCAFAGGAGFCVLLLAMYLQKKRAGARLATGA